MSAARADRAVDSWAERPIAGSALRVVTTGRSGNVFEETIECLLQIIRLGIVPPGERFPPERELADQLNVSRATLREAISELQAAGWVSVRRGRGGGTFVSESHVDRLGVGTSDAGVSSEELEDTFAWRRVIETGVAETAAGRALTAAQRAEMTTALEECRAAGVAEYRRFDSQLHLMWAQVTGSESLVRSMVESRTRINELLARIPMIEPNLAHSHEQHERIHTAILAGDAERARQAMAEHLDGTAALLRGFLSRTEDESARPAESADRGEA
ncbi:FadR/GntR family transcriptional regulator [Brevibacterium luteolum]|uniref:FadR/GntR family transcriptional regulator n=1 Tax=Brevibacterium luteolum TaxID=199591 RepID=UPI003EEF0B7F